MMDFAHWRKCDFQVHTPRDPNWKGACPIGADDIDATSGAPVSREAVEASRMQWAHEFVDACIAHGLQAVAITDHHEMVLFRYVQKVIELRGKADPSFDLWVFPGMELTAVGGSQCLLIFDADLSEEWRRLAQGKLGIEYAGIDENARKSPKVQQLTIAYPDIGKNLDELHGLRGRYIVLPNVSEGGRFTVLTEGGHGEFLRMPYVGGYLDNNQTIDTLGSRNRKRLSGTDKTWSIREIYPLPTSDCRSSDYTALGANNTWIKLAAATAEAIRQAFLGHKSRIHLGPPQLSSPCVVDIVIDGSSVIKAGTIELSPDLNSIIGGRGSGKSSLLEYIAFGLGRSCYDMPREHYSGNERMRSLVVDTVVAAAGKVALTICHDGANFTITRAPATSYQPHIRYPTGAINPISVEELRALFPAVVYAQGELAEIGKRASAQAQLTDLLQFVDPRYKSEDKEINRTIEACKQEVRATLQALVACWGKQAARHQLATNRDTLEQRVQALEKTLPALGGDDRAIVDRYALADAFESQRLLAAKHADQIMAVLQSASDLATERSLPVEPAEAGQVRGHYQSLVQALATGIEELRARITPLRRSLLTTEETWSAELVVMRTARDGALAKMGDHKAVTAQIIKLRGDLSLLVQQLAAMDAELAAQADGGEALQLAIAALTEANFERTRRTQAWACEIERLSSGKIKAVVAADGDDSEVVEALDLVAAKTGSLQATRVQGWDALIAAFAKTEVLARLSVDCRSILHWRIVGASKGEDHPACEMLRGILGHTENIRASMLKLMDTARLEAVSTALTKPQITLLYKDGARELSFDKASEGQRAAALLFMLLEQSGGPLIVDQPEGDLDNKIISDLTDKLHGAKRARQLIFASHNANVVVNGSSELVACMDLTTDGERTVASRGAIDSPAICTLITETMEGGEKAFKDRYDKYGY